MVRGNTEPQGQGVGVEADLIWRYFEDVDSLDPDRVTPYYADEGSFRFANHPPVQGHAAIRDLLAGFYRTIRSMSHHATGLWLGDHSAVLEAEAVFVRSDGARVSLPATSVLHLDPNGMITEFRFVMDAAPLA